MTHLTILCLYFYENNCINDLLMKIIILKIARYINNILVINNINYSKKTSMMVNFGWDMRLLEKYFYSFSSKGNGTKKILYLNNRAQLTFLMIQVSSESSTDMLNVIHHPNIHLLWVIFRKQFGTHNDIFCSVKNMLDLQKNFP